jgi:biopolymer transport protein ExbB
MENMNVLKLIEQGGIATYPLIFCSIIIVAVISERLFALRGVVPSTQRVTSLVVPLVAQGDFDSALFICSKYKKSLLASIYYFLLSSGKDKTLKQISDQLEEKKFEEVQDLKQNVWILGTIGSSAPFIGLFGTVVGIIKSFHNMAQLGTGGFSVVAGGISEALIATAMGLVVAIVAVIAYNYFQTKIATINTVVKINSVKFLEAYKEGRRLNGNREAGRKVG